jgi:cytohesin
MGHRISAFLAALILALGLAVAPVAAEPIHDAAYLGDVANLKKLLASGVKVDARESLSGYTPLHWAGTAEVAKVLLKAGAKVDARTISGSTPLHLAGTAEVAKVLLKAGAKVNARDQNGWTPLHQQAYRGEAGVVEFLLKAGANAKAKNNDGHTPFDWAKDLGTLEGTDAYWLLNEAQYD